MEKEYDLIAEFYDELQKDYLADIPLWLEYAEKCGSPILELACGTGRILLPLAQAGFKVTGVDISEKMLAKAEEKIEKEERDVEKRITLIKGDMREFDLKVKFDLVLIIFNSFQHLLTKEDHDRCLGCIYKHLNPDGKLIITVFNPDLSRPQGILRKEGDEPILDYPEKGDSTEMFNYQFFDHEKQITAVRFVIDTVKSNNVLERRTSDFRLRYFFPKEFERMLLSNGFEKEELFGNYDKSVFTLKSPFMILVAKRK
jgi:SAM-dependent methyltransferase